MQISDNEEDTKINKIKLVIKKDKEKIQEKENTENKIITEIQKIKKVDTQVQTNKTDENKEAVSEKIDKAEIQNIKKFLIEEYGVNEKCLEIN